MAAVPSAVESGVYPGQSEEVREMTTTRAWRTVGATVAGLALFGAIVTFLALVIGLEPS